MVEESGTLESQLEATKVTQTPLQFYSFIWEQFICRAAELGQRLVVNQDQNRKGNISEGLKGPLQEPRKRLLQPQRSSECWNAGSVSSSTAAQMGHISKCSRKKSR